MSEIPLDRGEKARSEAQSLADAGASVEEVLASLRASDFAPHECVRALRDVYGMTHADADEAVLYSATWADFREPTIELRETFAQALEQLAEETP